MAGNIYKYNIWNTYQERGMSNDDIASSLVGEVQRRFYNMSANDKQALGISDDMFSNSRLYNKLESGQLRAIYDDSSQPGIPSYQIELDLDGDGIYSNIPDVLTAGASLFVPERTVDRYKGASENRVREILQNKATRTHIEKMKAYKLKELGTDELSTFEKKLAQWWGEIVVNVADVGKKGLQVFEDAIGVELVNQQTIDQLTQQQQEEQYFLEQAIREQGITDTTMYKGDIMTIGEGENQRVIKSENILYDYISKHEGVKTEAYPDTKGIMTIGIGFRIDEHAEKFKKRGYDVAKLISKEQILTIKDIVEMFIDDFLPEYMGLEKRNGPFNLYGDLVDFRKQENSYLLLPLTDFNHWAGSSVNKEKTKSGFIGPTTSFYKHLRAYLKGDKSKKGAWGDPNPDTILGQLTRDYLYYRDKRKDPSGAKRISDNAELMQMWFEGRYARLPLMDAFQIP
jgi:hypothetical protein